MYTGIQIDLSEKSPLLADRNTHAKFENVALVAKYCYRQMVVHSDIFQLTIFQTDRMLNSSLH